MKRMCRLAGMSLVFFTLSCSVFAGTIDQAIRELRSLGWIPATKINLERSRSAIGSLPGYKAVVGADAVRARTIEDGAANSNTEAEVMDWNAGKEAVFEYYPTGYVSSSDWNDVDASSFLDQIKRNTEVANSGRKSQGLAEIHVSGWLQKPTLNPETHSVSWVIAGSQSDGNKIINAIALKLGRYGYERITFIDDASNAASAIQNLLIISDAHNFEQGALYGEYVSGSDHSAEYGIAGLVAGALGVKLLKVAGGLGLLVLAKKAVWIVLLPFYWLWGLIKRKVSRSSAPAVQPDTRQSERIEPRVAPMHVVAITQDAAQSPLGE